MSAAGTRSAMLPADVGPPLPRDEYAEKAMIAAILVGRPSQDAGLRAAVEKLSPEDFTGINPRYWTCFVEMIRAGIDPDLALAANRLHLAPDEYGYLANLTDGAHKLSNAEHYVAILNEKKALRRLAFLGEAVRENALRANGNGASVLAETRELISAHLREEVGQKRIPMFRSGADLAAATPEKVVWNVWGYIAAGVITEIGGKVKIGKTEFIMRMVRAIADEFEFLHKPTRKTATVYLTEQPAVSLCQAMKRADLLGRADFFVLSHGEVRGLQWPAIAAVAVEKCKCENAGLLVVDTLPQFAGLVGDSENNSGDALAAMVPLQQAASEGIAVLIVRHERKSGGDVGDSGRGSSAFAGAVDIVLSVRRPEGHSKKTVRLVQALSRFSETPAELIVELTEHGYISLGEPRDAAEAEARDKIVETAPDTEAEAVDLKELVNSSGLHRRTAQRAVDELLKHSKLSRIGKGKRGDAFRYFLPKNRFCATSYIDEQKRIESDPELFTDGDSTS